MKKEAPRLSAHEFWHEIGFPPQGSSRVSRGLSSQSHMMQCLHSIMKESIIRGLCLRRDEPREDTVEAAILTAR
jgi:hypothetical protein